jgi:citrate/tricarballylate utilization protein
MAEVRGRTYSDFAWPKPLGALYQRNGVTVSLALAAALSIFLLLALALNGTLWGGDHGGNFYNLFPHNLMVGLFLPIFAWSVLALGIGVVRFLKQVTPATSGATVVAKDLKQAGQDVLTLKYLDGGHGEGCHNEDDAYTQSRRRAHHFTFYGFMLCFAATSVATIYHYFFGWEAPYDLPSLPKVLGALGGISMLIGTVGLFRLKWIRHPLHGDQQQSAMDYGFIALLFFTSLTGLLLWWLRETDALALMLALHLGVVMALFATLPYGKFAHGVFRSAALVRYAVERRQPNPIGIGDD